jgi:hypothetical protein
MCTDLSSNDVGFSGERQRGLAQSEVKYLRTLGTLMTLSALYPQPLLLLLGVFYASLFSEHLALKPSVDPSASSR